MTVLPFIGKSRTLIKHTPLNPNTSEHTVESTRDLLLKIEQNQQALDFPITPRQIQWDFSDGEAKCRTTQGGELYWDKTSWSQIGRKVLPRYGAQFVEKTAALDTELAEKLMYTHCAKVKGQVVFRTIQKRVEIMKDLFQVRRYVRAVCTSSYTPFKDSTFFNDLLEEVGNKPLARFTYGDAGMDAKILMEPVQDEEDMYPVLNAWNSPALLRNAGVGGGAYRQICSNGLMAHVSTGEHTFVHAGRYSRIRVGIRAGIQKFGEVQTQLVGNYNLALKMVLDDPHDVVERLAKTKSLTLADVVGIKKSMEHETSSKYGTVANIVDGITHYAHNGDLDVWKQQDLEKLASRYLFGAMA